MGNSKSMKIILNASVLVTLLIVSIMGLYKNRTQCTQQVDAKIVDYRISRKNSCYITVDYTYNGQEYKVEYRRSLTNYRDSIGKTIKIYLNPKNPTQIYIKASDKSTYIFIIILVICILKAGERYMRKRV